MRVRFLPALALLALFTTAVPLAFALDEKSPAAKDRPDAWVAAKAKLVLWTDNDVEGSDINVDVKDGVVTLKGSAGSEAAKAEAERRQPSSRTRPCAWLSRPGSRQTRA